MTTTATIAAIITVRSSFRLTAGGGVTVGVDVGVGEVWGGVGVGEAVCVGVGVADCEKLAVIVWLVVTSVKV